MTNLLTLNIDTRGVAMVSLNRPEVHNAFNAELIAEITTTFRALASNRAVRLVVLFGHGKSFCAGGDLNWMRSMKDFSRAENIADSTKLSDMFVAIDALPQPLIGVVHGNALGGGSGLTAVCDFVLAADNASFGFTETRIGILPAVISPYVLQKIGTSYARAYFTSGMRFDTPTAQHMGLVHRVVPVNALDSTRDEVITEFLKAAPEASIKAKKLISELKLRSADASATRSFTIDTIVDARVSAEGQEGMSALLEGRKASWIPA